MEVITNPEFIGCIYDILRKKFLLSKKRACGQFLHHCKYISSVLSESGDACGLGLAGYGARLTEDIVGIAGAKV